MLRVATGIDFHRLVKGRDLLLGGVKIPHMKGLLGHSDGDLLLHAIADAILSAAGAKDIGTLFPAGIRETEGLSGSAMINSILESDFVQGVEIVNIDAVIVCDTVVLREHLEEIRSSVASILKVDSQRISIRAKRSEGLIFSESNDGIAVFCTGLFDIKT